MMPKEVREGGREGWRGGREKMSREWDAPIGREESDIHAHKQGPRPANNRPGEGS